MAASVPAVRNGSGSGYATVADADEDNFYAAMAVLRAGGSSKRTPPDRSILHVTDLPIKKRIQLINQQAAEIQTETKIIQLLNQETTETKTGTGTETETPPACDICNRTFASSRSVAIHKGHHIRRGRARMHELGSVENPNCEMNEQRQVVSRRRFRQSNGPGAVHECRRCWRSFISGQALGAHKRHCTWPPVEQEIVNNFDLNEVPPPEEEDNLVLPWHY